MVGRDVFRASRTNQERHGVVLAFRANIDHVVPWKLGGKSDDSNLVTACWSCNYGKAQYTLDQIGLDDPRDRKPKMLIDGWDGLTSFIRADRREQAE
jgi:5-methylcytosine-specific restriction endonuclease McrA